MKGAPSVILNVTTKLPVPLALVAETVTVDDPAVDGVPDITPVLVFKLRPDGKIPELMLKLVGLLLAVMV